LPLNSLFASIFNECLSFSVVGPLSHDIVHVYSKLWWWRGDSLVFLVLYIICLSLQLGAFFFNQSLR